MNGFFIFPSLKSPSVYSPSCDLLRIAFKNSIHPVLFTSKYAKAFSVCKTMSFLNLSQYSFDTTFGRFITPLAFQEWSKKQDKIKNRFISLRNDMINNYDEGVGCIKGDNKKFCSDLWNLIHKNGDPHENFVIEVSNSLSSAIISKIELYEKFKCEYYSWPYPTIDNNNIISYKQFIKDVAGDFLLKIDQTINPILEYKRIQINLVVKIKKSIHYLKLINIFNTEDVQNLLSDVYNGVNEKITIETLGVKMLELKALLLSKTKLLFETKLYNNQI